MFEHLSDPFPITKPLNKVARYVNKLYPDFRVDGWWVSTGQGVSVLSYHVLFKQFTVGVLYQDTYTNDVILALNTALQFGDYDSERKVEDLGNDLVVKWLECTPLLSIGKSIIFKVTREDIPNV